MPPQQHNPNGRLHILLSVLLLASEAKSTDIAGATTPSHNGGTFRAGAASLHVNPSTYPVHVSGMHPDRTSSAQIDNLYSRALVLDDGKERLALVVVDSCMLPRSLLDEAKSIARANTGIRTDRILISATHTHSAPAAMALLGTPADATYAKSLPSRIARSIELAVEYLEPARIGWTVIQDSEHTHVRRAILRSDKSGWNPWGESNDRVQDPGFSPADIVGPSGPKDADLSIIAIQSKAGRPLALLANYANHYYGSPRGAPELIDHSALISADYFGLFSEMIQDLISIGSIYSATTSTGHSGTPAFIGIMSQGASGDQIAHDYSRPPSTEGITAYTEAIARAVYKAYQSIEYQEGVSLAMEEATLTLNRRLPNETRLAWARKVIADSHGKRPSNVGYGTGYSNAIPYAYAVQQLYLHAHPKTELKLQAIRIGELGITAIPNEVYAITGIKLKAQSPLQPTINIELANGAEGYIPPPEQHALGGYTTWPAQSAGLEVQAEPKVVEVVLSLLEKVSGHSRNAAAEKNGAYAKAVLSSQPWAYWRLNEMSGNTAHDATGQGHHASYEPNVAFYLNGPDSPAFSGTGTTNRAPHFVGGQIRANLESLSTPYTIEFWFWNAFPSGLRQVTGWLFSASLLASSCASSEYSIGLATGPSGQGNRLIIAKVEGSDRSSIVGTTNIPFKRWTHVALVHDHNRLNVFVNGGQSPDITAQTVECQMNASRLTLGGRFDGGPGLEGKIDEVALYERALTPLQISDHFRIADMPPDLNELNQEF